LRAVYQRTDYAQNVQYFRAAFPEFWTGELVEYTPIFTCAGRMAPAAAQLDAFVTSFRIRPRDSYRQRQTGPQEIASRPLVRSRFAFNLEFIARVTVNLQQRPEIIGSTPAGFVASWYPASGDVRGPRISAQVLSEGTHSLTVQPDGVGLIDVDVSLMTGDRALIRASYTGVTDLGAEGYRRITQGEWPPAPTVRVVPRFLTGAPSYAWLNRLQCAGFGELRPRDLIYSYDLYAL
jgi:hypothetical protein